MPDRRSAPGPGIARTNPRAFPATFRKPAAYREVPPVRLRFLRPAGESPGFGPAARDPEGIAERIVARFRRPPRRNEGDTVTPAPDSRSDCAAASGSGRISDFHPKIRRVKPSATPTTPGVPSRSCRVRSTVRRLSGTIVPDHDRRDREPGESARVRTTMHRASPCGRSTPGPAGYGSGSPPA